MSRFFSRDFISMREEILNYLKANLKDKWTDKGEADELVILTETIAYVADALNWYIDFQKRESALPTAIHDKNILTLVSGFGYKPYQIKCAEGVVKLTFNPVLSNSLIIKKGTLLSTSDADVDEENIVVSTIADVTIPAGTSTVNIAVKQGEFLYKSSYRNTVNADGTINLDTPLVSEGSVKLTYGGFTWEEVPDVYMDWRVGKYFSTHLTHYNNLERFFIQLPYNWNDYVGDDTEILIEYFQTLGTLGNIASTRVNRFVNPVLDTQSKDVTSTITVTNEDSITGGRDREDGLSMKVNAISYLRNLDSLVTLDDYADFTRGYTGQPAIAVDWRTDPTLVTEPYKILVIVNVDNTTKTNLETEIAKRKARVDIVEVVIPQILEYAIEANVYLKSQNSGQAAVLALINSSIEENLTNVADIGHSHWLSTIITAIQGASEDIERVVMVSPIADVSVSQYQIPKITSVTINFV
jgi:hypothetical protein